MKKIHYLILCCLVSLLTACDKDTDALNFAPDVTTGGATNIFRKGATLSGKIQFAGESAAHDYGILVSEYQSMAESTEYPVTTGETDYKIHIQNLSPERTYYYCAYANSGYSTARGDVNSFQTTESNAPVFGEVVVDSIGSGSVRVTATIIDDGGVTPIISGFCWREGNSGVPTLIDNVVNVPDATGNTLTAIITGLTPLTDYVIAAYSVNTKGMGFSQSTSVQTEKGPGIYSLEDLVAFRNARNAGEDVSKWKTSDGIINIFADIDMSPIENWEPISQILEDEVFDGNNHTISNLRSSFNIDMNLPGIMSDYGVSGYKNSHVGMVSVNYGTICNLKLGQGKVEVSANENGRFGYGSICGKNYRTIKDCFSEVEIISTSGSNNCGGICGINYGEIYRSINRGTINLIDGIDAGGISGQMGNAFYVTRPIIEDCDNYGIIAVGDSATNIFCTSGICGFAGGEQALINRCNNFGNISGGITSGITYAAFEISNCTNYGDITGENSNSGISNRLGDNFPNAILINCINKGNISGGYNNAGIVGYINSDFVGKYSGNINEGSVNGQPGNEENAIGHDLRTSN